MRLRKHDAMYSKYGINQNEKCRGCCNFKMYQMGNKSVSKCAAYGVTHSEATDWNGRKTACGLYDIPFDNNTPLVQILKHQSNKIEESDCEGQMSLV